MKITSKEENISALVIGKSEHGKSAFIKSFAKHSNLINSTGASQTTRTNVKYCFSYKYPKAEVEIKFLDKQQFVELREEQVKEKIKIICENGLTEEERALLPTIITQIEGFFDIKEFDIEINEEKTKVVNNIILAWKSIADKIDKVVFNVNEYHEIQNLLNNNNVKEYVKDEGKKYNLIDVVNLFYEKIYDICYEEIISKYPKKFNLEDIDDRQKQLLTYCLRVENNKSVTGLILNLSINDEINLNYQSVLKNLNITQLTLIDTYGLDQSENLNRDVLIDRLPKIFNEYKEIETVFYIRGLGMGSPTDLKEIIPTLYEIKPTVIMYVIFSKIDKDRTVLDNFSQGDIVDLIKANNIDEIKAVNYFIEKENLFSGEKIDHDIKKKMREANIPNCLVDSTYNTLINNLIPYCSVSEKQFEESNACNVQKLLNSIISKEYLGSQIINIKNLLRHFETEEFEIVIRNYIKILFNNANGWKQHGNWRTEEANISRIKRGVLGYSGTYYDEWNDRFDSAYIKVFSKLSDSQVFEIFGVSHELNSECNAILRLFNQFIKRYLGCKKYKLSLFCTDGYWCDDCNIKDCFRKVLLSKYKGEIQENASVRTSWLSKVYNFNNKFDEDFVIIFINKLKSEFIDECRDHNIRIISQNKNESNKKKLQSYFEKYDELLDIEILKEMEQKLENLL